MLDEKISAEAVHKLEITGDWMLYLSGGCRNENEALFMSFGRLPLDVLILCPDLNIKCCLEDKLLYEVNYPRVWRSQNIRKRVPR